ncbi:protein-S-isoprenylcysteine O-methyltransferase Ste14 [Rhodothalassium salexigens DSM 2132]|uniref:Protein-S-isoprenylcysteine O-methyltransferase Ste14 n=1 Tax=Rhodothalassium salexigens DSM 2132 TaxID=1188247 RepID=A0A4R2PC59_RHOSA|nr:protein-S-isoprenylcysteine O-methyltransferase [Rhodothalassium salexigens]MBB4212212.1 protein-S-isoprenylcysteine O-methyltransferase Ste14 [Rhodothalassium salexigens DSM 2132]TCP32637.1 protein-S-isoprenylcysteine O-methyltransferase Ste14 [Rhodothalassium salexigens DSM 2132]
MTSLQAVTMALLSAGLVVAVVWRWQTIGWPGLVWLVGFVAMCAIRRPYARRVRGNRIVQAHKDLGEHVVLGAMFATMMILPLGHLATGLGGFADYPLPVWASGIGAALQIPFLWLFWRAHADLGRNWSPSLEVREDHGLVSDGVYARVRHPMYTAIALSCLAQALLIPNAIAGALAIPAFGLLWAVRVPREEAMLRRQFAGAYDAYAARTGALWPRWP